MGLGMVAPMKRAALTLTIFAGCAVAGLWSGRSAVAQSNDELPYWASIAVDEARMRKGPSPDVPVIWEYRRRDLPVRVVARYENWRKVEDPDGTSGWMAARLLSRTRTAIVVGGTAQMREAPGEDAAVAYRAQAGVVGRITDCDDGWCLFDVKGRRGWIAKSAIWGD
jgi:SH3-like domain-containing protein